MADKEMPCRIKGCTSTWLWYGSQQIRSFGKQAPERMCDKHLEQFNALSDREIKCRTPGCENAWIWKRGAQFGQLLRGGKLRSPSGLCASCAAEEREVSDSEVACKVEGCARTWTWSRDAQLRHRLWVRRQHLKAAEETKKVDSQQVAGARDEAAAQTTSAAEGVDATGVASEQPREAIDASRAGQATGEVSEVAEQPADTAVAGASEVSGDGAGDSQTGEGAPTAEIAATDEATAGDSQTGEGAPTAEIAATDEASDEGKSKKKRRRRAKRKRKRVVSEGPPERMCNICAAKLAAIKPVQVGCKVHGCTNSWTWDRASQLRAWAHLGTDEVGVEPTAPRRMCDTCREFCRKHPDRDLDCGRPDCDKQWVYKTGAQLQDYLAGRSLEPNRLCDACIRGGFTPAPQPSSKSSAVPVLECMPCSTRGCSGTWLFVPGQQLEVWDGTGDPPDDRLCDECRVERGLNARTAAIKARLSPEPGSEEPEESDEAPKILVLGERETPLEVEDASEQGEQADASKPVGEPAEPAKQVDVSNQTEGEPAGTGQPANQETVAPLDETKAGRDPSGEAVADASTSDGSTE